MPLTAEKTLKRTPLYDRHVKLGGKMVDFAGFELPISYSRIMEEHEWVRLSCGIFDVSHLGEVEVKGPGAAAYLEKLVPTDLDKITDSQILYTVLLNADGGVMDDILIYRLDSGSFYLVINAGGIEKVFAHLQSHATGGVELTNQSDNCCCVAIQGPRAAEVCRKLFDPEAGEMKYYHFKPLISRGKSAWISRSGYTGEDGFEIFADPETIRPVWDELISAGEAEGVRPAGLGARNTLRLEVGNALYGSDMDETRTPDEARLGWLVSKKKTDFIGREKLMERRKAGFKEKLCGFKVKDRAVARDGYAVFQGGKRIGRVTSGSFSPTLKENIGLAYVGTGASGPGTQLEIEIHGRKVPAEVVKLPFVQRKHV